MTQFDKITLKWTMSQVFQSGVVHLSNIATYLANNLIKRLEPHGEVVIVIQVGHALLALTLIVAVAVAAPPCVAVTVTPPQVRGSAPSQSACAEKWALKKDSTALEHKESYAVADIVLYCSVRLHVSCCMGFCIAMIVCQAYSCKATPGHVSTTVGSSRMPHAHDQALLYNCMPGRQSLWCKQHAADT